MIRDITTLRTAALGGAVLGRGRFRPETRCSAQLSFLTPRELAPDVWDALGKKRTFFDYKPR